MSERTITLYPWRMARGLLFAFLWVIAVMIVSAVLGMSPDWKTLAFAILVSIISSALDRTEAAIAKAAMASPDAGSVE